MLKDKGSMYWLKLMFQDMLAHGIRPISIHISVTVTSNKKEKEIQENNSPGYNL